MLSRCQAPCGPVCRPQHNAAAAAALWPVQHARAHSTLMHMHGLNRLNVNPCQHRSCWAVRSVAQPQATTPAAADASPIPADATTATYKEGDFVVVGTLGRAQGLKGEVRVYPVTDQPKKRLSRAGVRLWLQPTPVKGQPVPGSSQLQRVEVQHGRIIKPPTAQDREIWAVKFKGVADRTQASTLANFTLLLAMCDRERLADADEFFVQDLIGMKAYLQGSNQLIGAVTEVYDGTGTYDTLRLRLVPTPEDIRGSQYRTVLVPFVEAIVPVVDKRRKRLELTPPEGLLDPAVTTTTKLRKPYSPQQQEQLLQQLAKQQEQQQQQALANQAQQSAAAGSSEGGEDEEDEEEDEEEQQQTRQQTSYRQRQLALRQRRLQQRRAALAKKQS